jgi:hypothetical protein
MRRQNEERHEQPAERLSAWTLAAAAVAIMAMGCLTTFIALQVDGFRPRVGDMVVFQPGSQDADPWPIEIAATEVSGETIGTDRCKLDPTVMAKDGGSLVVEARLESAPPIFRLHWAGRSTAAGQGDCGPAADMTVTKLDLQKLANAAGGFGVAHKGFLR